MKRQQTAAGRVPPLLRVPEESCLSFFLFYFFKFCIYKKKNKGKKNKKNWVFFIFSFFSFFGGSDDDHTPILCVCSHVIGDSPQYHHLCTRVEPERGVTERGHGRAPPLTLASAVHTSLATSTPAPPCCPPTGPRSPPRGTSSPPQGRSGSGTEQRRATQRADGNGVRWRHVSCCCT